MSWIKLTIAVCLALSVMLNSVCAGSNNLEQRDASINSSSPNNTILITINPGQQLRGFYRALVTGTIIYKFWGIRYGQPPTGDKRFAEPEAATDWQGVRDALQFGHICWQTPTGNENESEDCLFLNVYTPSVTGALPVMVWIHGGGYNSDSGSNLIYDGSTLAGKGVVVVTINYRLGALGFSSTEDDVMPGNYGLLDQVLVLKWVQKNIHAFGGNPGKVTIFGESAGSSSVSLQVLSPLSKGLFHRAIMESGCSLSVWAVQIPTATVSVREYTRRVGDDIGCVDTDSTKFLACLRKADAQVLFNASYVIKHALDIDIIANPRVETKFGFLPHYPQYILENGLFNKVDTLRGFNSGEWAFVINDLDNNGLTRDEFRTNFYNVFRSYSLNNRSREYLADVVRRIFLGNETNPIAIRQSLINSLTDTLFAASEFLELDDILNHGGQAKNHYVYQLDYRVKSILHTQSFGPDWWGVIHTGDLPLVFTDDQVGSVATLTPAEDFAVGDKMQTWWTNFAKFGNPSATRIIEDGEDVHWDPYSLTNPKLLHIDVKSHMASYARYSSLGLYRDVLDYIKGVNSTSSATL